MRTRRFMAGVFLGTWALSSSPWAATFPDSAPTSASAPLSSRFVLVPSGPGASTESGMVEFGGPANAVTDLSVRLQRLAPGLYWIVMVRNSDNAAVPLAPITVSDTPDFEPDRQASDDPRVRGSGHQVQVLQTQALIKLPTEFDLADVARIEVEDINGAVLLEGRPGGP